MAKQGQQDLIHYEKYSGAQHPFPPGRKNRFFPSLSLQHASFHPDEILPDETSPYEPRAPGSPPPPTSDDAPTLPAHRRTKRKPLLIGVALATVLFVMVAVLMAMSSNQPGRSHGQVSSQNSDHAKSSPVPRGTQTIIAVIGNQTVASTSVPAATGTPKINQPAAPAQRIGVFRSSSTTSIFYLKDHLTGGYADRTISFGKSGDIPLAGNWTGNGVDYIGVYRPSTATFYLTTSNDQSSGNATYQFVFGNPNWLPIVGDWTGSHRDSIGAFDPATNLFFLKYQLPAPSSSPVGAGYADATISLGNKGDLPIAGKWVASWGHAGIGVFRPGNDTFYLSSTVTGGTGASPVVATVLSHPIQFGTTGDQPVTGDWNGDGQTGIGVFRPSSNSFYLKDDPTTPGNPSYPAFGYGDAGDKPVIGYWGP